VSAQLKSFEGPDVQLLLDRIRTELGPGAKINGAEKIRVGGVLGFFAKEHYRVVVETPGTVDDRSSPPARRTSAAHQEPPLRSPPPAAARPDISAPASSSVTPTAEPCSTSGPVAEPVPESFGEVLGRVATTLESDQPAAGHHPTDDHPAGAPDIASKAALFLATAATVPPDDDGRPERARPGPADAMVAALRRVGLEESMVTAVAEGLQRGGDLEALLLEAVLLEALGGLPTAAPLPRRAGSLLVVVGAGAPARRLAAAVAGEMGVDPVEVPFASRDAGAYAVVTGKLLVRSAEEAAELAPGWRRSKPAVVVVDAAVTGGERSWASHVIASLRPTAVWGVVDSTSKTEDVAAWIQALGGVDALALENLDATVSPAAALGLGLPVARIDGQPATAARWVATIVDRVDPWV
jgi:hypothetical protein